MSIEKDEQRLENDKKRLALDRAELAFRKKKAAGKVTQKDKAKLRELRRDFRENHRTPKTGASPKPIGG